MFKAELHIVISRDSFRRTRQRVAGEGNLIGFPLGHKVSSLRSSRVVFLVDAKAALCACAKARLSASPNPWPSALACTFPLVALSARSFILLCYISSPLPSSGSCVLFWSHCIFFKSFLLGAFSVTFLALPQISLCLEHFCSVFVHIWSL